MKKLIVTGDDFGLAIPVNEAIEEAHRQGILTATSLMVGAGATTDAIERARRLPSLRVGLHLVLVRGRAILPHEAIPGLTDERREFSSHLVQAGIGFFIRPGIRQQLEREVRAQFQAFQKTGLHLDHVNCHNHMHLHPTLFGIILRVGREYGMKAMRLPHEPLLPSWFASRKTLLQKLTMWLLLTPWVALLRNRLKQAHIVSNQFVFGMNDSGRMDAELVQRILRHLPNGVTEIYFHPATRRCPEIDQTMENYRTQSELAALTNPTIRQVLLAFGVETIAFSDL